MARSQAIASLKDAALELRISRQALGQIVKRLNIQTHQMPGNGKGISASDRRRILAFFESEKSRKECVP